MSRYLGQFSLFAVLLIDGASISQSKTGSKADTIVTGSLGKKLDRAIQSAAPNLWGSVLVARKGQILLAKGYGSADYKSTPNTARTLHELASISKQVTATAILHLWQRKKLKLDDPMGKFFRNVPKEKRKITVRQLLTHTSGISPRSGVAYASTIPRKKYVRQLFDQDLIALPGTEYKYNNPTYALLAAVVEVVSKQSFESYCEKHLFGPARCKDTGFIGDRDLIRTKRASTRRGKLPDKTAADWYYGWGYRGMGGVVTTVLDFHRWDRALRKNTILKKATRDALYTPNKNFYAGGWNIAMTPRNTRVAHHSGGVEGYGNRVARHLEDDVCILALSNDGGSAFRVIHAVESILFETVPVSVRIDVSKHGGGGKDVVISEGLRWQVKRAGRGLQLSLTGEETVVLELRFPRASWGKKLLYDLEQATSAYAPKRNGQAPSLAAHFALAGYGPSARIAHEFGLPEFAAEVRRRSGPDERPALILKDARSGGLTGTVSMDLKSALDLLAKLEKAVGR